MNSARSRSTIDFPETQEDYRRPVAYLICNQSPPGGSTSECLLTFREVETLFQYVNLNLLRISTFLNMNMILDIIQTILPWISKMIKSPMMYVVVNSDMDYNICSRK